MKQCTCFLIFALISTLGCGNYGSSSAATTAQVRVLQGAPDLGLVQILADGSQLAPASGPGVFLTPPYIAVKAGSLHFQEVPDGASAPVIDKSFSLSPGSFNTVAVIGQQSNASLTTLLIPDDHTAPDAGQIKVRFLHGASTIDAIDIYTVPSNITLPAPSPTLITSNLSFKSVSPYFSMAPANTSFCAVPAGSGPPSSGIPFGSNPCLFRELITLTALKNVTLADFDPPTVTGSTGGFLQHWVIVEDLK